LSALPLPLARDVAALAAALRDHPQDPFARDLAVRLTTVADAPDPQVATRELVDGADLAGLERLRPAPAARATLEALVRLAHDLPASQRAPVATVIHGPIWWSLAGAGGGFLLGWLARMMVR
jgi:hypothetical protein